MKKTIIIGMGALIIVLCSFAFAGFMTSGDINRCGIINQSGVYTLTKHLTAADTNITGCINISLSHAELNCKGYYIRDATSAFPMVAAQGTNPFQNITIRNCNTSSKGYGTRLKINKSWIYSSSFDKGIQGLYISNSADTILKNLTINNNSGEGLYILTANNMTLTNITANYNGQYGLRFYSTVGSRLTNITARHNRMYGLHFTLSSHNTLNNVLVYNNSIQGIYMGQLSLNNTIIGGVLDGQDHGIFVNSSANNSFSNLNISNPKDDAILLVGVNTTNLNLTNITILNPNASHYDLNVSGEGINGTWIIDTNIGNYTFTGFGSLVNFKNTTAGSIEFITPINGSGTNLSRDIIITNSSVFVNSSNNVGLNQSANVTLIGVANYSYPVITKDGVICSSPACHNFTPLNAQTIKFNVSSWSTYRITNNPPSTSSGGGGGVSRTDEGTSETKKETEEETDITAILFILVIVILIIRKKRNRYR